VRRRAFLAWAASGGAAAALAAISCGQTPARAPVTHTVTIEGMRFTPESLTVKVGDSVVWVNRDMFPHSATSRTGGFDSASIAPEQTWTYTTTTAGDFPYVCSFHPTMKGGLRVE
jgi:plastocyanin